MKRCPTCKEEKADSEFYPAKKKDGTYGLQSHCKECGNIIRRGRVAKRRIVVESMKCNTCKEEKPASAFSQKRRTMTGLEPECKACRRIKDSARRARDPEKYRKRGREDWKKPARWDKYYQRMYGISLEQYQAMVVLQDGRCFVCEERPEEKKKLHVDHDHITGKVRRLLCNACNAAIGYANDNPDRLERLAAYLRAMKD